MTKDILGYLSLAIALVQYIPYIYAIACRRLRPHVFPRLIWFLTTSIVAVAQYSDAAGPGGWTTILSSVSLGIILLLAFRNGDRNITRGDWAAFIGAVIAIPLWIVTKDPFGAVLLVTVIDGAGYYPAYRKGWHDPYHDSVSVYIIDMCKHTLSFAALEHYSFVTAAYPLLSITGDGILCLLLLLRRRALSDGAPSLHAPD